MDLNTLTNDGKYLISSMYKEYVARRKDKISKEKAVSFNSVDVIHNEIMNDWTLEDTLFTCRELKKHGFITATNYGEDEMILITLTTEAISLMENKFKDDVSSVLEFAGKIKALIPFV